jgi:hypothetical protein
MSQTTKLLSLEGDKLLPFLPKLQVHFTDGTEWYFQTLDEAVQFADKKKLVIRESHQVKFDEDLFDNTTTDIYTLQALLNSLLFAVHGHTHFEIDFFDKFYAFLQLIKSVEDKLIGMKTRFEDNYKIIDHYKTCVLESE